MCKSTYTVNISQQCVYTQVRLNAYSVHIAAGVVGIVVVVINMVISDRDFLQNFKGVMLRSDQAKKEIIEKDKKIRKKKD
jgi:hypothetical protein